MIPSIIWFTEKIIIDELNNRLSMEKKVLQNINSIQGILDKQLIYFWHSGDRKGREIDLSEVFHTS